MGLLKNREYNGTHTADVNGDDDDDDKGGGGFNNVVFV